MSEGVLESVGQSLRGAREAKGMSLEDVALRLRLMQRQIEAMETDDFDSLGQPVFARGFVRNYARLLGLAPESVLSRMPGAPTEPAAVSQSAPALPRSWLSSPWLILALLALLILVAAPVALYLWLNSDVPDEPAASEAPSVRMSPAASPATAPVPEAFVPDGEPEAAPAEAGTPAPADAVDSAPDAAAPESAAPPLAGSILHLEFGAEAWTEIKDATGRMLHRELNAAGTRIDVAGKPPFDIVIGNASEARLTYNGRPIDLKPFTDGTVARFALED